MKILTYITFIFYTLALTSCELLDFGNTTATTNPPVNPNPQGQTEASLAVVISPDKSKIGINDQIVMSCQDKGAKIYYTLDGTAPGPTSALYSAPLTPDSILGSQDIFGTAVLTATIKAVAVGSISGPVAVKDFTVSMIGAVNLPGDHAGSNSIYDYAMDTRNNLYALYRKNMMWGTGKCEVGGPGVLGRIGETAVIDPMTGRGDGFSGDGGDAAYAKFNGASGLAVDTAGNGYIVDRYNYRIRMVTASDMKIKTIAGDGTSVHSGDGGPASSAQLTDPTAIVIDGTNVIYLADGNRIRKIDETGIISTVAGTGIAGCTGDGGPAINADIDPEKLELNADGTILYFTDSTNNKIRSIDLKTGSISTIAGSGGSVWSGDGPALSVRFVPFDIVVATTRELYISDNINQKLLKLGTDGIVSEVGTKYFGMFPAGRRDIFEYNNLEIAGNILYSSRGGQIQKVVIK